MASDQSPRSCRRLVLVGHGMVGYRLIRTLHEKYPDSDNLWDITVLAEEADAAYDRVGLTSYAGNWDRSKLALPDNEYAHEDNVHLFLRHRVEKIDLEAKTVLANDNKTYPYDTLILATGSRAFVPPVPGNDLPGCHVYRTLDDLDAIHANIDEMLSKGYSKTGVVIGGGLLGLEAANALRKSGIDSHIVEMAPRLMPQQLDDAGGVLLAKLISDLGIAVHIGVGTHSIEMVNHPDHTHSLKVRLSNGTSIDAGLVIFAAGIRPRDELARAAGLDLGPHGGVLTDICCRTSDPDVYAIGEVAAIEGVCYGLVGPGYASAEVVAAQLMGEHSTFGTADLSTKLKLLGVDVASFGDAMGKTPNSLSVVVNNPVTRTYSKLVLSDDAKTLLGGILVGDTSSYGVLRSMVGSALPVDNPISLISPVDEHGGPAAVGVAGLPDSAQICSCNQVSKAQLIEAINKGCHDIDSLKQCTKAGTSCGSCIPLLKELLADQGIEQSHNLCEHFAYSRAELFEIIQSTHIRTFSEILEKYGTGYGCDICKPTIASILASTGPIQVLDKEYAQLWDTNDRFMANMQRNGSYGVIPRVPGGQITPEQLILLGQVAQEFGLYTKICGSQRVNLLGAKLNQLPQIWKRLVDGGMESGYAYGKALRNVKSCLGNDWCRYGQQDSVGLAIQLELRYRGLRAPHKFKMGVSGCARECAEARAKDVGVIATEHGWNLYVCGNGAASPRHADLLVSDIDTETLIRYIDRFLMFYIRTADRFQRTAHWLEALEGGIDHVRDVVVNDSLGIAEELEQAMQHHVDTYRDEWKETIEDPEKLAEFVSFVNAPDTLDPDVKFIHLDDGRMMPVPVIPEDHLPAPESESAQA